MIRSSWRRCARKNIIPLLRCPRCNAMKLAYLTARGTRRVGEVKVGCRQCGWQCTIDECTHSAVADVHVARATARGVVV